MESKIFLLTVLTLFGLLVPSLSFVLPIFLLLNCLSQFSIHLYSLFSHSCLISLISSLSIGASTYQAPIVLNLHYLRTINITRKINNKYRVFLYFYQIKIICKHIHKEQQSAPKLFLLDSPYFSRRLQCWMEALRSGGWSWGSRCMRGRQPACRCGGPGRHRSSTWSGVGRRRREGTPGGEGPS